MFGGLDQFGGRAEVGAIRSQATTVRSAGPSLAIATKTGASCTQLDLLKGFRLKVDGVVVDLTVGQQRLVAYLALQDRPLNRSYIAEMLWSDCSSVQALGSLRTALWRLHEIGRALVDCSGSHIQLNRWVSVDVRRSAELARRLNTGQLRPGDLDVNSLDQLIDSGDLLPDWYDDWVAYERERIRQLRVHALEAMSRDLAAAGRFALAVEAGLAAVRAEPLRDSAHRALISAHMQEGNPSEAVREYRLYRDLVQRELHVGPSKAMDALVQGLHI